MPDPNILDDLLSGLVEQQRLFNERLAELERHESPLDSKFALAPVSDTWTPAYAGSTTAGVFTYSVQVGYYIKVAGMVFLFGQVTITAIPTPPAGTMRITGLPFAGAATYRGAIHFPSISQFKRSAGGLDLGGIVTAGNSYIELRESLDNAVVISAPAANFVNVNCSLTIGGAYLHA